MIFGIVRNIVGVTGGNRLGGLDKLERFKVIFVNDGVLGSDRLVDYCNICVLAVSPAALHNAVAGGGRRQLFDQKSGIYISHTLAHFHKGINVKISLSAVLGDVLKAPLKCKSALLDKARQQIIKGPIGLIRGAAHYCQLIFGHTDTKAGTAGGSQLLRKRLTLGAVGLPQQYFIRRSVRLDLADCFRKLKITARHLTQLSIKRGKQADLAVICLVGAKHGVFGLTVLRQGYHNRGCRSGFLNHGSGVSRGGVGRAVAAVAGRQDKTKRCQKNHRDYFKYFHIFSFGVFLYYTSNLAASQQRIDTDGLLLYTKYNK